MLLQTIYDLSLPKIAFNVQSSMLEASTLLIQQFSKIFLQEPCPNYAICLTGNVRSAQV